MHIEVALCILFVVFVEKVKATTCKVPNGDAGECVTISQCKPLWELYKKKHKTNEEHQYIAQSYCGNPSSSNIKMCCPGMPSWDTFEVNPVTYTKTGNDLETESEEFLPPLIKTPSSTNVLENDPFTDSKKVCGAEFKNHERINYKNGAAIQIDQYPWLVVFEYYGGALSCCGSLISSRFVLTAAHCLNGVNGPPIIAHLTEYFYDSFLIDYEEATSGGGFEINDKVFVNVERAFIHPGFSRTTLHHDIGLVKLLQSVVLSDFVTTVCLPTRDYKSEFTNDTVFFVAVWGDDIAEDLGVKKEIIIPYVPMSTCRESLSNANLTDSQICAGGEHGIDTCKGDSGGPLMYLSELTYVVVGVVSYGPRDCGREGVPAVYTHVFKYLNWIKSIVQSAK